MRFLVLLALGLPISLGSSHDGGTLTHQLSAFLTDTAACSPNYGSQPHLVVEICSSIIETFFKNEQLVTGQAQSQGLTTGRDQFGAYISLPRGRGFVVHRPDCTFSVTNLRGGPNINAHVRDMSLELKGILQKCPRYTCHQVITLDCKYSASFGAEFLNAGTGIVYSTQP